MTGKSKTSRKIFRSGFLTFLLSIFLCLCVFVFSVACLLIFNNLPKHNQEEIDLFEKYRDDFEYVTDYVIENFDDEIPKVIRTIGEEEIIGVTVRFTDFFLDGEIKEKLNRIKKIIKTDFSEIEITPERIAYGGEWWGGRIYVYSRNGKVPNYFFHKGDGVNEDCYSLGENWYLLEYYP